MQHSAASAAVLPSPMLPRVHAEGRVLASPRTYWPLAETSDARTSILVNIAIFEAGIQYGKYARCGAVRLRTGSIQYMHMTYT